MFSRSRHRVLTAVTVACALGVAATSVVHAQVKAERSSAIVGHMSKAVLLDPTTYAAALVAYDATLRDWNTSQPLFNRGFLEHNYRFTVSGHADDLPLSRHDGRHQVLMDAITQVEVAAVHNLSTRVVERVLLERYPERRRLIHSLGWLERVAVSSYFGYVLSVDHYRQAAINTRQVVPAPQSPN